MSAVSRLSKRHIYTKEYARENGLPRQTEIELVEQWILSFGDRALFSKEDLHSAIFLLDAGYDSKSIQRSGHDQRLEPHRDSLPDLAQR